MVVPFVPSAGGLLVRSEVVGAPRDVRAVLAETPIGGKTETRLIYGTEHGLDVAVVERDRGGRPHARAVRRLDAPER